MLLPDAAKIPYKAVLCLVAKDRHIKLTLSADTCSVDDSNANFKDLERKIGKRLKLKTYSWSYQNITNVLPLITFLLSLVYPVTILKRPQLRTQLTR